MTALSVIIIVKNGEKSIRKPLDSVKEIAQEIIVIDNNSTDRTHEIASEYTKNIYHDEKEHEEYLRKLALTKTHNDWTLVLDADEELSQGLQKEIRILLSKKIDADGFLIPYQNYFLGRPIYFGGEDYKVIRLFNKKKIHVTEGKIHAHYELKTNNYRELTHKIDHYSYQSITQILKKFTRYAKIEAIDKYSKGERTSIKKIILYPLHMFYSRYIEDKGYKDTPIRVLLDFCFAYMEWMMYVYLLKLQLFT